MADKYFVDGGGALTWNLTGNWATTSGGAGGTGAPGSTDNVFFDINSPNMTGMTSSRSIGSINFTGYTNTFTQDFNLNISGAAGFTISSSINFVQNATVIVTTNSQLTTGGFSFTNLNIGVNSGTITLNDDVSVTGTLTLGSGSQTCTMNGTATITCSGSLVSGTVTGSINGAAISLLLNGTGNWTTNNTTGGLNFANFTINTAGTITMSTSGGTYVIRGGNFTHTAGTVITGDSTILFATNACTIDTVNVTWNNVTFQNSVTHVLSSNLNVNGILQIGNTTGTTTINGSQINIRGGLRYGGTAGVCGGTTIMNLIDNMNIDAPSRTTGRFDNPIYMNAPGKTIYFDDNAAPIMWSNLVVTPGTILMSSRGTFPTVGLMPQSIAWLE